MIGLGHIAQAAVLPAFAHAKNSKLVALVSGDAEKRSKLARKYRCDAYDVRALDDVLDRPDVDAVYIAEPNDKHVDFAVRCAKEGVHVLCEKPLAVSEEECRRMIDACKEAGVKLMTAYRLHFEESNLEAVRLIEQGRIGEDDVRFPRQKELPEGWAVQDARSVGAGRVDGPDLVVDAQQHEVDAREIALVDAPVAAAVVAADEDPPLELVAPDRVRRGEIAGLWGAGLDGDGGQLERVG